MARAPKKTIEQLEREARELLASLVGRTITAAEHDTSREGTYTLTLDDGRKATFSACGDDMTYVTFGVE